MKNLFLLAIILLCFSCRKTFDEPTKKITLLDESYNCNNVTEAYALKFVKIIDKNGVPLDYDYVDTGTSLYSSLYMNWGYDGDFDNARYSIYGNWELSGTGRNYTYDKVMMYNFRLNP